MKHSHFDDDLKPKVRKKIYERYNWKKNENGHFVCPQGRIFSEIDPNGTGLFTQYDVLQYRVQVYEPNHCQGCPVCCDCTEAKSRERKLTYSPEAELYKDLADEILNSPEGQEELNHRKHIGEGAFANIKHNHGYDQANFRSLPLVTMEAHLHVIGNNLRKLKASLENRKKFEKKNEQLIILDVDPVVQQYSLF